jgi:thiamine pyrophosphokinase
MLLSRGNHMGLVLLDGPAAPTERLERWLSEATFFLCADGAGGRTLPRLPDAIVGDLDSIGEVSEDQTLIRLEEQDRTDAEKCVELCFEAGCDRVVLLGEIGGRWDHSLVQLALPLAWPGQVLMAGSEQIAMGVSGKEEFRIPEGRALSLFPLFGPARGVTLRGCLWPLEREDLLQTEGRTASNRVCQESVSLEIESGSVLLICEHRSEDPLWRLGP